METDRNQWTSRIQRVPGKQCQQAALSLPPLIVTRVLEESLVHECVLWARGMFVAGGFQITAHRLFYASGVRAMGFHIPLLSTGGFLQCQRVSSFAQGKNNMLTLLTPGPPFHLQKKNGSLAPENSPHPQHQQPGLYSQTIWLRLTAILWNRERSVKICLLSVAVLFQLASKESRPGCLLAYIFT